MIDKLRQLRADHLKIQHGITFYPYQEEISDAILIALLDNLRITAGATEEDVKRLKQVEIAIEISRQAGKTYAVGHTGEFILTFLPTMFKRPIRIGIFAAQVDQAKISYGIMRNSLRQAKTTLFQVTDEQQRLIAEEESAKKLIMPDGSSAAIAPINKTSQIEGLTLDLIIIDEAQVADDGVVQHSIWPMGKTCVCAGTKIYKEDGTIVNVETVRDGERIIGFDKDKKEVVVNTAQYAHSGYKPCVEITTNSGRKLRCSTDHPLLVKLRSSRNIKWLEAEEIKLGTQLAIADEVSYFGDNKIDDPRLVGMLIGDGSYRQGGIVRYCSCDKELLDYVKASYEFKSYNSYPTKQGKVFEDGTIKGLTPMMRGLGLYGQTGKQKRLPQGWYTYDKDTLSLLLAGLYDTDGCIFIEDNRRAKIHLASSGKDLLVDVSYALEKFGIHTRLYESTIKNNIVGKHGTVWNLVATERQSIVRFAENIPLLVGYKSERLLEAVEVLSTRKNKRQANMNSTYFERVVKIEDIGEQEIFNMTAEGTNTYLANGIITHNTNAPRVYIGKAGTQIKHFYRLSQKNETIKAYFNEVAPQRRKTYEQTGDVTHLIYEQSVKSDIEKQGIDADEIQREYFGKWQIGTGQFITQDQLEALEDKDRKQTFHYKKSPCFAGLDTAKHPDSTVLTILRPITETVQDEKGEDIEVPKFFERTLPDGKTTEKYIKKEILNWMELRGENYQNQFDIIKDFLSKYQVLGIAIDSTGQGDFMPDMFENNTDWQDEKSGLYRIKFSSVSKDALYKNLKVSIQQLLTTVPNLGTKLGERFKQQMLDLQQEYKGQLLSVHHPDVAGAQDDFADSWALAEWAFAQYYANTPQVLSLSAASERIIPDENKDDEGNVVDYWPGL